MNFSSPKGAELFKELIKTTDVLENFRTGTMEKWGLGWEELKAINPGLVMVRVTGFGQTGPYRHRRFRHRRRSLQWFREYDRGERRAAHAAKFRIGGWLAASYGTFATMFALYHRDAQGSGEGQFIDLSIYEPIFQVWGAAVAFPTRRDPERMGNRSDNNAPRNTYETRDRKWVAISTNSPAIVKRVLTLCGGEQPQAIHVFKPLKTGSSISMKSMEWLPTGSNSRIRKRFSKSSRKRKPVVPRADVSQIFEDPQYQARGDIVELDDEDLGKIRMTSAFPFMSETPAEIRHAGPRKGQHNEEILCDELGVDPADLQKLAEEGAI